MTNHNRSTSPPEEPAMMPEPDLSESAAGSSDASHLGEDHAGADLDAPTGAPGGLLDADAFYQGFRSAFNVCGALTGLQSLPVADNDEQARAASDALYETILETPALHFLVTPGGKWLPRIMVVAGFAVPKAAMVKSEIAARRAPMPRPEPGNDNNPPDLEKRA